MNILIITGGATQKEYIRRRLKEKNFDKIIAADAGLACCDELSLYPTEILGDFDSLNNSALLKKYRDLGIPIVEFPTRKDYTDTHLAIAHAVDLLKAQDQEYKCGQNNSVTIFGALGTRIDHCLANIGLLARFAELGIPAAIEDKNNKIEMIKGPCVHIVPRSEERPYTSLISFSEQTTGITLEGFSFPLNNATLRKDVSLGISNEIIAPQGKITIESGYLLVVQAAD